MKPIILCYSRSGNTEKIALQAKQDLNCEAIKIVPEEAYGNYISACLRVSKEKKNPVPPAFVTPLPDLDGYDVILLGYPVWAQDVPRFVADFIEKCDLTGKTVIPFATYAFTDIFVRQSIGAQAIANACWFVLDCVIVYQLHPDGVQRLLFRLVYCPERLPHLGCPLVHPNHRVHGRACPHSAPAAGHQRRVAVHGRRRGPEPHHDGILIP